ncbi:aminoglycoside 3 phosphotransferase choline kinase [Fusarium heterosporum]|uniref:Aminoglycoside 3 phosphotransferase choline kinase n=1 Tax=Fusarium heterosporum TaxID=42747 RepID=A0A8H5WH60_FUSHE|nr:aminoglycoside 3 phosphotransferase choline kinase [Fusarium heterosporum]
MSLPSLDKSVLPTTHVETMNPARAQMLIDVAREEPLEPEPDVKMEDVAPPIIHITGANRSILGDASLRASRGSQISNLATGTTGLRESTSPNTSSSLKRSISVLVNEVKSNKKKKKQNTQEFYTRVQSLGQAPRPDDNTRYLGSLLRNRTLTICLQPPLKKKETAIKPKIYEFRISQAGLVQHEKLSTLCYTRCLALSLHDQDISGTEGAISRTVVGELLEDVWPKLNKKEKYALARQLRNIIRKMRSESKSGPESTLGSIGSGQFSLLQDKHPEHTYYAIRTEPKQEQFMALLMSTLYETVPGPVSAALTSQFRVDYPSVLTHGAICPRNIVVSKGQIAWILGWDCAGQYPVWWEYARFFEARTTEENSDWYDYAVDIFEDVFPRELAAYQGIARCQQP